MYAKVAINVRKSCRKPKINFIVPPIGRMNTNAKSRGGLRGGSVVRSVTIECKHGDAGATCPKFARYLSQINRFKCFQGIINTQPTSDMSYSAVYRRSQPAQYQPSCSPTGPALRLILGCLLAPIHGLVRHPRLVLYIYHAPHWG